MDNEQQIIIVTVIDPIQQGVGRALVASFEATMLDNLSELLVLLDEITVSESTHA